MKEDELRKFLSGRGQAVPTPRPRMVVRRPVRQGPEEASYRDFSATHLFCGKCQRAMPVREKLLLVLPDGDLYDYVCTGCGGSTGTRKAGGQ